VGPVASLGIAAAFASLEEEHLGTAAVTASASWEEDLAQGIRAPVSLGTLATAAELIQGTEAGLLVAS